MKDCANGNNERKKTWIELVHVVSSSVKKECNEMSFFQFMWGASYHNALHCYLLDIVVAAFVIMVRTVSCSDMDRTVPVEKMWTMIVLIVVMLGIQNTTEPSLTTIQIGAVSVQHT